MNRIAEQVERERPIRPSLTHSAPCRSRLAPTLSLLAARQIAGNVETLGHRDLYGFRHVLACALPASVRAHPLSRCRPLLIPPVKLSLVWGLHCVVTEMMPMILKTWSIMPCEIVFHEGIRQSWRSRHHHGRRAFGTPGATQYAAYRLYRR